MDVNADGTIVGETQAADKRYVAARWGTGGTVTRLASLATAVPGTIDFATAINTKGVIVGSSGGDAALWTVTNTAAPAVTELGTVPNALRWTV